MSLRERLRNDLNASGHDATAILYQTFGLLKNPFPPAGEPSGHPHMPTKAEETINDAVVVFHRDRTSQVLLVEGTQGVGKTNLLSFFQGELQDAYQDDKAFYIIRYYPDPEQTFDGIIRRLFQELGAGHLCRIASKLASLGGQAREKIIEQASGHEMRLVLHSLAREERSAGGTIEETNESVLLALDWLVGMRVFKRHRELLGVQFRLDTVESKTQALRDLVFCSSNLDLLKGIFLLLDELEKQDYSVSKVLVLRYLSAIRALIDSLPKHLFLLVALTKSARRRYFEMLPAFAGRLQNIVSLEAKFYTNRAIEETRGDVRAAGVAGTRPIVTDAEVRDIFRKLYELSSEKGLEGVSHRDYLNALFLLAESKISSL